MNLSNFLEKLKKPPTSTPVQYFYAIEISPSSIKTAIWQIVDGQASLLHLGPVKTWDSQSTDNLVRSLKHSLKELPTTDPQPYQVIFGLPLSWVSQNQVSVPRKRDLAQILKTLSLEPVGFVVIQEALVTYLKDKEGTPPSAIATHVIARSPKLSSDVQEALARFKTETPFPAHLILFDSQAIDLDQAKQDLLSSDWSEELSFQHIPQIDTLPVNASITAIALAGGIEAAKNLGIQAKLTTPKPLPSQDIPKKFSKPFPLISRIKLPKIKFHFRFPSFSLPHPQFFRKKSFIIIFVSCFLIFIPCFLLLLPKAEVDLKVKSEHLDETIVLTSDLFSSHLKTVSGSNSLAVTGTTITGEKATGEVTIFNRTSEPADFSTGDTITANDLVFLLDQDLTVASASSGADYTVVPGKASTSIIARKIGEAYNLASDTEFAIKNYSALTYIAKNPQSFSGGTQEEVTAVSQADQTKLKEELTQQLIDSAYQEIKDSRPDDFFLQEPDQIEIVSQDFSDSLGEPTESLDLQLQLEISFIGISQSDIDQAISAMISDHQLSDYQIIESSQELALNQDHELELRFQADLTPKFSRQDIIDHLRARHITRGINYLEKLDFVDSTNVSLWPPLPSLIQFFPFLSNKIKLDVGL
jgi:hypothetical protein